MSVRPLRKQELAAAGITLAASFDDDPLFRFLLPDAARRQAMLRWFLESALRECLAVGGAFTPEDGGPDAGAIGLIPPGHWPMPFYGTLASLGLPRALPTLRLIRAGLRIEHEIRRRHPPAPHVYVYLLGVHPTMKGKGFGALLMRHACALAAQHSCRMHLETSNPVNLTFYRRFELEVASEIATHRGPPVWTMTTPELTASA